MAKLASKAPATGRETQSGALPALFPIERLFEDSRGLEAWSQVGQSLLDGFGALQSEATRFVTMRIEQDLAVQRELAGCHSPAEAMEVYSAFGRKAMQDYLDEAGKVSDIAAGMTKACSTFGETLTATVAVPVTTNGSQPSSPAETEEVKPEAA